MISDLDGVVWRGSQTLPGASWFFAELRRRGLSIAFATNNSGKTPGQYVERLESLGIAGVEERDVITSGVVTAAYLTANYPPGSGVHVLGNPGLKAVIAAAGFVVNPARGSASAPTRVVVASVDNELTYDKLAAAATAVLSGADLIGTNGDPTLPVTPGESHGSLLPGSGSVIAALEVASGRGAKLMGKPEAPMFDHALGQLGRAPQRTLMIGDRLDTDILGAQRSGLLTALVLTGSTTADQLERSTVVPDLVCSGLFQLGAELFEGWPAPE